MGTVVVGVDGSSGAREALRFAAREAALRRARLRAVAVWHVPTVAYAGGFAPEIDPSAFEQDAKATLDEALAALGAAGEGIQIERAVLRGQPAQVLVDESAGADLLVVGSRGHGGFAGLLLGSVSQQCAHHASCPVAIVPSTTGERE